MRRVGHLVGVDADEATADADLSPVERLDIPHRPVTAKGLTDDRCGIGQKSTASAHLHFEQQRLALVHRHAAGAADRLQPPFDRETPLIKSVAGLVQHTHQRARKIILVVARRNPHVFGGTATKRVSADVEPAVLEIEADPFHQQHCETALRFLWKASHEASRRRRPLAGQSTLDQIGQESRDFSKQAVDYGDRAARLVLINQSLIWARSQPPAFDGADLTLDT